MCALREIFASARPSKHPQLMLSLSDIGAPGREWRWELGGDRRGSADNGNPDFLHMRRRCSCHEGDAQRRDDLARAIGNRRREGPYAKRVLALVLGPALPLYS